MEKHLRVDLYHAKAALQRAEEGLPKAVKAKDYKLAGSYQSSLYGLQAEVRDCLRLLELYELEFHGNTADPDELTPEDLDDL